MTFTLPKPTTLCAILLAFSILPIEAAAQSIWLPHDRSDAAHVTLEVYKPFVAGIGDPSPLSSAYFVSGRVPISQEFSLSADLPVSYYAASYFDQDVSDATLGNPYLGVAYTTGAGDVVDVGIRLPVSYAVSFAGISGYAADFDRIEAFLQETLTASGHLNGVRQVVDAALRVRVRAGLTALIPFDRNDDGMFTGGNHDTRVLVDYGLTGTFTPGDLRLSGGVTGRLLVSGDGDIWERLTQQMTLVVGRRYGGFEPAFVVRAPLDTELNDIVSSVVGLQVAVLLD